MARIMTAAALLGLFAGLTAALPGEGGAGGREGSAIETSLDHPLSFDLTKAVIEQGSGRFPGQLSSSSAGSGGSDVIGLKHGSALGAIVGDTKAFFAERFGSSTQHFPSRSIHADSTVLKTLQQELYGPKLFQFAKEDDAIGMDINLRKWGSSDPVGDMTLRAFDAYVREGGSAVFSLRGDGMPEGAKAFKAELEDELEVPLSFNVYHSGPEAVALKPHTDRYDVLVVQIEGEKDWELCSPMQQTSSERATYPDYTFSEADACEVYESILNNVDGCTTHDIRSSLACYNTTLTAGDTLYMPKGVIHSATTRQGAPTSTHLTIGVIRDGLQYGDLLRRAATITFAEHTTGLLEGQDVDSMATAAELILDTIAKVQDSVQGIGWRRMLPMWLVNDVPELMEQEDPPSHDVSSLQRAYAVMLDELEAHVTTVLADLLAPSKDFYAFALTDDAEALSSSMLAAEVPALLREMRHEDMFVKTCSAAAEASRDLISNSSTNSKWAQRTSSASESQPRQCPLPNPATPWDTPVDTGPKSKEEIFGDVLIALKKEFETGGYPVYDNVQKAMQEGDIESLRVARRELQLSGACQTACDAVGTVCDAGCFLLRGPAEGCEVTCNLAEQTCATLCPQCGCDAGCIGGCDEGCVGSCDRGGICRGSCDGGPCFGSCDRFGIGSCDSSCATSCDSSCSLGTSCDSACTSGCDETCSLSCDRPCSNCQSTCSSAFNTCFNPVCRELFDIADDCEDVCDVVESTCNDICQTLTDIETFISVFETVRDVASDISDSATDFLDTVATSIRENAELLGNAYADAFQTVIGITTPFSDPEADKYIPELQPFCDLLVDGTFISGLVAPFTIGVSEITGLSGVELGAGASAGLSYGALRLGVSGGVSMGVYRESGSAREDGEERYFCTFTACAGTGLLPSTGLDASASIDLDVVISGSVLDNPKRGALQLLPGFADVFSITGDLEFLGLPFEASLSAVITKSGGTASPLLGSPEPGDDLFMGAGFGLSAGVGVGDVLPVGIDAERCFVLFSDSDGPDLPFRRELRSGGGEENDLPEHIREGYRRADEIAATLDERLSVEDKAFFRNHVDIELKRSISSGGGGGGTRRSNNSSSPRKSRDHTLASLTQHRALQEETSTTASRNVTTREATSELASEVKLAYNKYFKQGLEGHPPFEVALEGGGGMVALFGDGWEDDTAPTSSEQGLIDWSFVYQVCPDKCDGVSDNECSCLQSGGDVDPSCGECREDGVCLQCATGYWRRGPGWPCIPCDMDGCLGCKDGQGCQVCQDGYDLAQIGQSPGYDSTGTCSDFLTCQPRSTIFEEGDGVCVTNGDCLGNLVCGANNCASVFSFNSTFVDTDGPSEVQDCCMDPLLQPEDVKVSQTFVLKGTFVGRDDAALSLALRNVITDTVLNNDTTIDGQWKRFSFDAFGLITEANTFSLTATALVSISHNPFDFIGGRLQENNRVRPNEITADSLSLVSELTGLIAETLLHNLRALTADAPTTTGGGVTFPTVELLSSSFAYEDMTSSCAQWCALDGGLSDEGCTCTEESVDLPNSSCKLCGDDGYCSECAPGFYKAFREEGQTGEYPCRKCGEGCAVCADGVGCQQCLPGFIAADDITICGTVPCIPQLVYLATRETVSDDALTLTTPAPASATEAPASTPAPASATEAPASTPAPASAIEVPTSAATPAPMPSTLGHSCTGVAGCDAPGQSCVFVEGGCKGLGCIATTQCRYCGFNQFESVPC